MIPAPQVSRRVRSPASFVRNIKKKARARLLVVPKIPARYLGTTNQYLTHYPCWDDASVFVHDSELRIRTRPANRKPTCGHTRCTLPGRYVYTGLSRTVHVPKLGRELRVK